MEDFIYSQSYVNSGILYVNVAWGGAEWWARVDNQDIGGIDVLDDLPVNNIPNSER